MHDDRSKTEARIHQALESRMRPSAVLRRQPCEIAAYGCEGRIPVAEALAARYTPIDPGTRWGVPWSTTWFRLDAQCPRDWQDLGVGFRVEARFDLGFNDRTPGFQSEGLAYSSAGMPLKGVQPRNNWLPVTESDRAEGRWSCFVEAVAMPVVLGGRESELDRFRPTPFGDRSTAGDQPLYVLGTAELVMVDEEASSLAMDVEVLLAVMETLAPTDNRRHEILRSLERVVDALDLDGDSVGARAALKDVLSAPAARTAHLISAVGHAHLDSAWLWPVSETVRKAARTFANVTMLCDQYPELVFACSQAVQWWWMKEQYPTIYQRMRELAARGQFLPVGGMWVEPDTNVTGAESLVRQLVFGKRFFLEELGIETEEVWLPDCFGYSAALPQLIALSGSRWFLTQKLSWNDTNTFPHHSFWWEGIDGTRIFTHFPPVDTYHSELLPSELAHADANYAERGYGTRSLAPFGYGDGGGGPTREMMERARRLADLDGSPRLRIESAATFFNAAQAEHEDAPVWSGELYMEGHRGTITSQVEIKQGNRRSEHRMREAELWCTAAFVAGRADYPHDELADIWRTLLLNQFHDILPGSSIAMVNDEAVVAYGSCIARLEKIIEAAITALARDGQGSTGRANVAAGLVVGFNAAPHAQAGSPAFGAAVAAVASTTARVRTSAEVTVLENDFLRIEVDANGHLASLVDKVANREVVPPGDVANVLQLHADYPNAWPAWDIDAFYRRVRQDVGSPESITVVADGPAEVAVRVAYRFGESTAVQILRLGADADQLVVEIEVDWHEHDRLLKVALPFGVHADVSSAEIQFGHVRRPTHTNTSWDVARFEIVAHRYLHVGEPGYGVAVVNDGIYGHEVVALKQRGGGRATLVRLTLVRATSFPDPRGERGVHRFRYAIVPGAGIDDAVQHGYWFNLPLRIVESEREIEPLLVVENPAVVVEAVKAAEDRSGDVVVRIYESGGSRAETAVTTSFPVRGASITDLLERPLTDLDVVGGTRIELSLRPFQVITLRFAIDH